jgi:hypothetical protein
MPVLEHHNKGLSCQGFSPEGADYQVNPPDCRDYRGFAPTPNGHNARSLHALRGGQQRRAPRPNFLLNRATWARQYQRTKFCESIFQPIPEIVVAQSERTDTIESSLSLR